MDQPFPPRIRAVVTGAGSGLGRAFCRQLSAYGARIVAADIREEGLRETAALLDGTEFHPFVCDVSDAAQVEALATFADTQLGGTDLVVNNAGVAVAGRTGEIPLEDWRWIVGINFMGVVHGCHAFVPRMRKQGQGWVLNVASAAGLVSTPTMAPYNATKAAVVAYSETLFAEERPHGIAVTVLCPTFFPTNIHRNARSQERGTERLVDKLMSRSALSADDVARVALEGIQRRELYVLPHADGRRLWAVKRLWPAGFQSMVAKGADKIRRRMGA